MRTYSFYIGKDDTDLDAFFDGMTKKKKLSRWICEHGRIEMYQDRNYIIKKKKQLVEEIARLDEEEKAIILGDERKRFGGKDDLHSSGEM